MLFDNLGFFCPIVELWPVLNPPNVVVDVTFGLIYLVTFQKVYLKPAAFVRYHTLTTNFRYRRLGDLNREPATLCACAGGEQQTIIKIVIHFL